MTALGPYLAGCVLLVAAGAAKTLRPTNTARALALRTGRGSLRGWTIGVRVGAIVELGLGVAAGADVTSTLAVVVSVSYTAFACYVADARRRGGVLATCGCFGEPDTPPTRLHVATNVALALASLAVAVDGPSGSLPAVLAHQPLHGVALGTGALVLSGLLLVALTSAARLSAGRLRRAPRRDGAMGGDGAHGVAA